MAILKCKMCGGDMEIAPDKTFGTCEYCGSTMTLPKVSDEQRATAFNRGNHFRRTGEFDKALSVYERIVAEDDSDAEAHWCCALCRFGIEYVEDPVSYEWLPTCHRASFDSFLEDVDYKAAVEYSEGITKRQYQKDAAKIAEVQKGILATSQNEKPFDVFICYKESDENGERTRDSLLAQEIYYQLTEQGKRVFFARITLEDKAGTEYEPYIFAALNSAKVMVVVGTKPEYFNAVWVKNEWSRFLSMMKRDRSKLLLPCYKDMDPYDLPEALSVLQSYDMSKIGFVQDLLRGINKVLGTSETTQPSKQTVVIQSENGVNITSLLKRAYMALEDRDWDGASNFFNRILDIDAEYADAYIGLFLVDLKFSSFDEYIKYRKSICPDSKYETLYADIEDEALVKEYVQKYSVPNYLTCEKIEGIFSFDFSYKSKVPFLKRIIAMEEDFVDSHRDIQRAVQFGKKKEVDELKENIVNNLRSELKKCEAIDSKTLQKMREAYKIHLAGSKKNVEQLYENLQFGENRRNIFKLAESENINDLESAINYFECFPQDEEMSAALLICKSKLRNQEEQIKNEILLIDKKICDQQEYQKECQKTIDKINSIRWMWRFILGALVSAITIVILAENESSSWPIFLLAFLAYFLACPIYYSIRLKRAKRGHAKTISNIAILMKQKELLIEGNDIEHYDADYAESPKQKPYFNPMERKETLDTDYETVPSDAGSSIAKSQIEYFTPRGSNYSKRK